MHDFIFQLHTPEEFRYLSSVGHWIAGYIFLAVVIVAFLQKLGFLKNKPYIWPILVTIAGNILIPYNILHHKLNELPLVLKVIELDSQQRQHFIMFNLIFIGGVTELLISMKKAKAKLWHFVWPAAILIIGLLFLTHPQHGNAEALAYTIPFHKSLGIILIIAAVGKSADVIWSKKYKWIAYLWIFFLFISSIMLISYNEPIGAYQMDHEKQQQNSKTLKN